MPEIDEKYLKSENYVNREMSWLEFDFRILGRPGTRQFRCLSD